MSLTSRVVNNPFKVAEPCSAEVAIVTDVELVVGDAVEVQFPNSWLLISGPSFARAVQTSAPAGKHYVSAAADNAKFEVAITERNPFFPEGRSRHGRLFTATLVAGSVPAGGEIRLCYANTIAPYVAEVEELYVRVKGQAPESAPELVTRAGEAECERVIVPSGVKPGQSFEVLIASLDRFENRSETRYEDGKLELVGGDGAVADGLSFTGACRVEVSLPEEGVYRFRFGKTVSNAVKVAGDACGPYWGDIHLHSKCSCDAMGCDPYGYSRDVSGLDFAGVCDHSEDLGEDGYEQVLEWARAAHRPGKFVTVFADERNPEHWTGHHNVYFRDEESFLRCRLRAGCLPRGSAEESQESTAKIEAEPGNCLLIPHHTGMGWRTMPPEGSIGCAVDLDAVEDDMGMRPFMEIYGHHGQSEVYNPHHILAYEFNRMRNPESRSNTSVQGPFYAQNYWLAGKRMGVIGSSDEHSGQGGRRHGGLAAVRTDELTREGIFDALRARHSYATTGERILVEFSVDGVHMGQEAVRKPGTRLPVRLQVWGTSDLVRVDVLRHRFGVDDGFRLVRSVSPRIEPNKAEPGFIQEGVPLMTTDAVVEFEEEYTGPVVYYARALQLPLEWPGMAWTSPVWITPE
jgi:Protein of unknown function (DUF3604)